MFIYDLDGTLANGTNEQIRKVLEISKSKNAKIIYATGRGIEDFYTLQYELLSKNCKLNLPDFLIANNGEKIYTKYNNQLIKNYEYSQFIKENTNFDKAYITKKISSINNSLEELESSPMTIKYNVPANINIRELRKNILEYLLKDKINILCGCKRTTSLGIFDNQFGNFGTDKFSFDAVNHRFTTSYLLIIFDSNFISNLITWSFIKSQT